MSRTTQFWYNNRLLFEIPTDLPENLVVGSRIERNTKTFTVHYVVKDGDTVKVTLVDFQPSRLKIT